jgi:hypothetical protein
MRRLLKGFGPSALVPEKIRDIGGYLDISRLIGDMLGPALKPWYNTYLAQLAPSNLAWKRMPR